MPPPGWPNQGAVIPPWTSSPPATSYWRYGAFTAPGGSDRCRNGVLGGDERPLALNVSADSLLLAADERGPSTPNLRIKLEAVDQFTPTSKNTSPHSSKAHYYATTPAKLSPTKPARRRHIGLPRSGRVVSQVIWQFVAHLHPLSERLDLLQVNR
jgi:hypothetical protein